MARDNQLPPTTDWLTWLILAGRGWGKTRTGAEWVQANHQHFGSFLLAGRTAGDLRDIMIEGPSGILKIAKSDRPLYEPSKRRLVWPNGTIGILRSADEPEGFRGLSVEAVWADELAAWNYPDAWDQLQLGFREGERPRQVVTTTPRPTPIILDLMEQPSTVVTTGSTFENAANLAPQFINTVVRRYEGTRLGRQELYAEILRDIPGALWTRDMIAYGTPPQRWAIEPGGKALVDDYQRVVVAVDPAVTYGPDSDETGIVVGANRGDIGYIVDDVSGRYSPDQWAQRVIAMYHTHRADAVIAESNNGGELVRMNIQRRDPSVPVKLVTASRGKVTRAEPVSALYEQGRVYHVRPFPELEDQLCTYTKESSVSPDRLDALVWALTDLMLGAVTIDGQIGAIA